MSLRINRQKFSKYLVWVILAVPGFWILERYLSNDISYGQVIHETGDWSFYLLFLTLAVTPIRRVFAKSNWPNWLMKHRRAFGVASFGYAAFHTIVYLDRKWGYGYILEEAKDPGLITGWIALAIFLILAISSNDLSVRALRRNWTHLHRTVYIAAGLTFAHWILTSIETQTAYICLGALCLIECLRFVRRKGIALAK